MVHQHVVFLASVRACFFNHLPFQNPKLQFVYSRHALSFQNKTTTKNNNNSFSASIYKEWRLCDNKYTWILSLPFGWMVWIFSMDQHLTTVSPTIPDNFRGSSLFRSKTPTYNQFYYDIVKNTCPIIMFYVFCAPLKLLTLMTSWVHYHDKCFNLWRVICFYCHIRGLMSFPAVR